MAKLRCSDPMAVMCDCVPQRPQIYYGNHILLTRGRPSFCCDLTTGITRHLSVWNGERRLFDIHQFGVLSVPIIRFL